ncbi:MAG: EAL domain-containing protein, partial [Alphaproteobacteria bacterium]|nr:EAL domain-containing protein [Alphaproteobacteria bacterium]
VLAAIAAAILLTGQTTESYLISGALLALAVGQAAAALIQDGRFRSFDSHEIERARNQHELSQSVGRLAERVSRAEDMLAGPERERTGAIANELHSLRETVSGLMREATYRPRMPDMAPPANQPTPEPARERLELLLEPIVELSSGKTEHYRALAQMTGGQGGPVDHDVLMAKADEGGLRGPLDLHLMRLALPVLRRLRQRHPALRIVVPIGRATLQSSGDLTRMVQVIDAERDVVAGLALAIAQDDLAVLSPAGIESVAILGHSGITFCLAASAPSGIDLALLRQIGIRFIDVAASSLGSAYHLPQDWSEFALHARAMQMQLIAGAVATGAQADLAAQGCRYAYGSAYAPPRKVRNDAGQPASAAATQAA